MTTATNKRTGKYTPKDEAYFHTFLSGPSKDHVESFCRRMAQMADEEGITMRKPEFIEVLGLLADKKL